MGDGCAEWKPAGLRGKLKGGRNERLFSGIGLRNSWHRARLPNRTPLSKDVSLYRADQGVRSGTAFALGQQGRRIPFE